MNRRSSRALAAVGFAVAVSVALTGAAAGHNDHPAPAFGTDAPVGTTFNSGGPGASWKLLTTIATGNPLTDLDFFTQRGETYMSVGTLAVGANGGGQTLVRLTENGEVSATSPHLVSSHPSAACPSDPAAALGLQHDAEATPKGNVIFSSPNPHAVRSDGQLIIDSTDNEGRCHDGGSGMGLNGNTGTAGSDPQGGLEIIDITDPANPEEIALTAHIGEAHTTNVDPKRPHIAFAVSSDSVTLNNCATTGCVRANEDPNNLQRFQLDGFEVVDLSSCMNFEPLTSLAVKRMICQPQVYRYRYPRLSMAKGHTINHEGGCHELEIYPNDLLTCASVSATMLFDLSGAFDDNGTPNDFTDDRPRGTPLPCRIRDSSSVSAFFSGAKVTDCVFDESGQELTVPRWLKELGGPSLEGVQFLGSAFHQGRPATGQLPPHGPLEDIEVSHEAELTESGRFILATDERGGGVLPPQATCSPGLDNPLGNGGIHAYRVDGLLGSTPATAEEAWSSYARTPEGGKAVYRAKIRSTKAEPIVCTAHVFHQIPGQNRIFMGWYSQGTQVVDFVEHTDGTIEFREAGWFIPENANTWTSAVFKMRENADGTFTYWGATGDFSLGTAGRNAIDIWEVTLPAPPEPLTGPATAKATGGGWLAASAGKKVSFSFGAEKTASGASGSLSLRDPAAGVTVDMTEISAIGFVSPPCRSIADGPDSLELRGSGTFNGGPATFRACVQDRGKGSSAPPDRFFLECLSGCDYSTAARTADDDVDGGNIQVRRPESTTSTAQTTVRTSPASAGGGGFGQTQQLTVTVYGGDQQPTANRSVTLTGTGAEGALTALSGVTGVAGTATFVVATLAEPVEWVARVDGVESNPVTVAPLLP